MGAALDSTNALMFLTIRVRAGMMMTKEMMTSAMPAKCPSKRLLAGLLHLKPEK